MPFPGHARAVADSLNPDTKTDRAALADVLDGVFDVLDEALGDFDPYTEESWTEEEIRDEYPLFWAIRRVNEVRDKLRVTSES